MRVLLVLFIAIPLFSAFADDLLSDCSKLPVNLQNCEKYVCKNNDEIGFYVFGYKNSGECNYVEVFSGKEFMSCNLSKSDLQVVSLYLSRFLSNSFNIRNTDINSDQLINHVIEVYSSDCSFFDRKISKDARNNEEGDQILAEFGSVAEVGSYRDSDAVVKDVRSILFSSSEISFLSSVFGDIGKSDLLYLASFDRSTISLSNEIRLDSILYMSPYVWKVWVNGALFQGNGSLRILDVLREKVIFAYSPRESDIELLKKNPDNRVFLDKEGNIRFVLEIGQVFRPENLSIR